MSVAARTTLFVRLAVVAKQDEDGGAKHDDDHGKDNHKCDEA